MSKNPWKTTTTKFEPKRKAPPPEVKAANEQAARLTALELKAADLEKRLAGLEQQLTKLQAAAPSMTSVLKRPSHQTRRYRGEEAWREEDVT